ncbi:MAG TPA: hypothetical protein VKB89_26260 [Xanthobacteraceae bacterium]|nr:hypothetical protein [Xanthobacteraceae bacterium]
MWCRRVSPSVPQRLEARASLANHVEERTAELLALALRHHRSGELAEAEVRYREILAIDPNHADSLHLLGAIEKFCYNGAVGGMRLDGSFFAGAGKFRCIGNLEHDTGFQHSVIIC